MSPTAPEGAASQPRQRSGRSAELACDVLADPEAWVTEAVAACLRVRARMGRRYGRRLDDHDRLRDVDADVTTLAARRVVPLVRQVLRPLPAVDLDPVARAFNRLEAADRFVLRRLDRLAPPRGARGLHLVSALERLAQALDPADGCPSTGSQGMRGPKAPTD